MYTILKYANGQMVDGLILSVSLEWMRVILRHHGETTELRRVFGEWTAEDGSPVELESMVAGDHTDLRCYSGFETPARAQTAD